MEHTVLVVEDETGIRKAICIYMKNQGYRVLDAPNGLSLIHIWYSYCLRYQKYGYHKKKDSFVQYFLFLTDQHSKAYFYHTIIIRKEYNFCLLYTSRCV